MERRVWITEDEYRAIMRWEDDGATPTDVHYEIIRYRPTNEDALKRTNPVKPFRSNDQLVSEFKPKTKIA